MFSGTQGWWNWRVSIAGPSAARDSCPDFGADVIKGGKPPPPAILGDWGTEFRLQPQAASLSLHLAKNRNKRGINASNPKSPEVLGPRFSTAG